MGFVDGGSFIMHLKYLVGVFDLGVHSGLEATFAQGHRAGEAVEGDAGEVVLWEDDKGAQPTQFAAVVTRDGCQGSLPMSCQGELGLPI